MRRVTQLFVLAAFGAAGLATGVLATSGGATPSAEQAQAVTRVTVVMTEFKFKLSKKSVPKGTVIFIVKNKGKIPHDFKIAGKKTKLIAPGKSAKLRVTFKKKRRFAYVCTVPGHARLGMKGVLGVGVKPPPTTTTTTTTTTTVPGPATTVQVGMFEYRYELSQSTIPSGTVTFVIANKGDEPHNFDIAGVKSGAILGPGQTETWTVGLPPKEYTYVCDVPFHIDRGMVGVLNVTSS